VRVAAATSTLAKLLKASPEWRLFFKACCESEAGALRVRSQAWQFRDELRARDERGEPFHLQDVEDALLAIARKVLPKTPAAQWDPEWAAELIHDALARLAERYVEISARDPERDGLDLSRQEAWEERIHAATLANDPAAFREALRGWELATGEALETWRSRRGAA
jgi:hypothetical protein